MLRRTTTWIGCQPSTARRTAISRNRDTSGHELREVGDASITRRDRSLRTGVAMDDDKKTETRDEPAASSAKPLAVQVVDAIIDGAASIAKSVVVETAERMGRSAAKTKAGKVAASLVDKAESLAPRPSKKIAPSKKTGAKKAAGKKAAGKKAVAKRAGAKKPTKKAVKKTSKKSPAKKRR
jgi:hypothetical protein